MVTLANLHKFVERGHRVTVIQPSTHHYYSGMGPGMLGTTYRPEQIRFATKKVVEKQGGSFVLDSVTHIEPEKRIVCNASGDCLEYDVLSFNAGSYVPRSKVVNDEGDIFSVKPIEKLLAARERIAELAARGRITVGIVGGGPSSAEVAGNILQLVRRRGGTLPRVQIFSGSSFMGRFPERVRQLVRDSLQERGVEIVEQGYVGTVETGRITLENGTVFPVDLVFLAMGVEPSPIFRASRLDVGPDGGLLVNRFLQCPRFPELFGGGDCIFFEPHPLDKVGVYAVRQNPVLFHNLLAALEGGELQAFDPGGPYLLIFNLGDGLGVLNKRWLTFGGRTAFVVKDWIDRRFIRRFQAIE